MAAVLCGEGRFLAAGVFPCPSRAGGATDPPAAHNGDSASHAEVYAFEDLTVGLTAKFCKTVTEADIVLFAAVTGDTNPMHLNAEYAEGPSSRNASPMACWRPG